MRLPRYNPEGFFRSLSPNNAKMREVAAAEDRGDCLGWPPEPGIQPDWPPFTLVGRRRAKIMRRQWAR